MSYIGIKRNCETSDEPAAKRKNLHMYTDRYSDIQLKSHDESIGCHKLILDTTSIYFRKMFDKATYNVIELTDKYSIQNPGLARTFIELLYGTMPHSKPLDLINLVHMCHHYGCLEHFAVCKKQLIDTIDSNNWVVIYSKLHEADYIEDVWKQCLNICIKETQSQYVTSVKILSYHDFMLILNHKASSVTTAVKALDFSTEYLLFVHIIAWLQNDQSKIDKYATQLLNTVMLETIPLYKLFDAFHYVKSHEHKKTFKQIIMDYLLKYKMDDQNVTNNSDYYKKLFVTDEYQQKLKNRYTLFVN
jgi:hypothetical protein